MAFLLLGRWQLNRLEERRASNAVITELLDAEPLEWSGKSLDTMAEFTRLLVRGTMAPEEEVLLRSQVHEGRPGFDVLTPLYLDEDTAVIVNRGWVPFQYDTPPVEVAAPDGGLITVEGVVRMPIEQSSLGPTDAPEGRLETVSRVDLERLQSQILGDLAPFYVEVIIHDPPTDRLPIPGTGPELGEGSHLAYAVQWFGFAAISFVGYAALIRSTARRRRDLSRRGESPQPDPS
jgi:surfeit locus 1 family protein